MTNFNIDTVRILADKYFEATISPEESVVLREAAAEITTNPGNLPGADPQLFSDLSVIASIYSCMDQETSVISGNMPEDLEMSLDSHISSLARKSRTSIFRRLIMPVASCAAVAAILVTIGMNIRKDSDDTLLQPLQPAAGTITAMATTPDTVSASPSADKAPETSHHVAVATVSSSVRKQKASKHGFNTISPAELGIHPEIRPENIAITKLPEVPEFITDISSMVAAASIDPAKVMIQPLTTYSQVVFNVCETADIVSDAFSGISETLAMVSRSISSSEPDAE